MKCRQVEESCTHSGPAYTTNVEEGAAATGQCSPWMTEEKDTGVVSPLALNGACGGFCCCAESVSGRSCSSHRNVNTVRNAFEVCKLERTRSHNLHHAEGLRCCDTSRDYKERDWVVFICLVHNLSLSSVCVCGSYMLLILTVFITGLYVEQL